MLASAVIRPSTPGVHRALVVDDEVAIRRVLRRYLERTGWAVEEAGDGRQAEARLFAPGVHWDLVICDLNLPDCTGLDLRRDVAARAPGLVGRFVVSTGESADGSGALGGADARELASRGCLLAKPFTLDELAAIIGRMKSAAAA